MSNLLTPYTDEKVKYLEKNIVRNYCKYNDSYLIDEKINYLKKSISFNEQLYSYCQSKYGYKKYLHDMWQHVLNGKDYLQRSKDELKELESNYNEYKKREEIHNDLVIRLLDFIKQNPGILQTDIYIQFGKEYQYIMSKILYDYAKNNQIKRVKNGKTYAVYYNESIKIADLNDKDSDTLLTKIFKFLQNKTR